MDYLIDFLSQILVWLKDLLLWVPRKLSSLILDGLASLIESIPVPDWLANASGFLAGISPEIAYFLAAFEFEFGLTVVLAAYIIRFLIRRIPVVG